MKLSHIILNTIIVIQQLNLSYYIYIYVCPFFTEKILSCWQEWSCRLKGNNSWFIYNNILNTVIMTSYVPFYTRMKKMTSSGLGQCFNHNVGYVVRGLIDIVAVLLMSTSWTLMMSHAG